MNPDLVSMHDALPAHSGGSTDEYTGKHSLIFSHTITPDRGTFSYPGEHSHVKEPSVSVHCES